MNFKRIDQKNSLNTNPEQNFEWVALADKIYDNEIGKKVFIQLKKEKKLHVCESGWGLCGTHKIQVMHCGFDYYNEIDVAEARELLMTAGNLYLREINDNEKIRPYLANYPFKPENIQIAIFLKNPNGSKTAPEKLRVISITDGLLRYDIGMDSLTTICEETYDEAAAKLGTVGGSSIP